MSTDAIVFIILSVAAGAWIVFHTIPRYMRYRKREAEAERKRAEECAKKAAEEHQEDERKARLRERDGEVDPILREILLAKVDLQRLLDAIDEVDIGADNITQLQNWHSKYEAVMDFYVFKEIAEYFPEPDESEPALLKGEIEQLLDEHCDALSCLSYTDEKMGIQRGYEYWDGANSGGVNYERGDGRYEDVNARFERILRKLPGTDRGYVYILTNPSLPGLVKIGKTHRSPEERARELSDLSGVPTPFVVAFSIMVSNCGLAETMAHQRLSAHRVADNREFFSVTVQEAVKVLKAIVREIDEGGL
jgi:hypothetical protein